MKARKHSRHLHHVGHIGLMTAGVAVVLSFAMLTVHALQALTLRLPGAPLVHEFGSVSVPRKSLARLPLLFEENAGQFAKGTAFVARYGKSVMSFRATGMEMALPGHILTQTFLGAKEGSIVGVETLPTYSNYFLGKDAGSWRTRVANFASIRYEELYPGVQLDYFSGAEGELSHMFRLAPHANPGLLRMDMSGVDSLSVADGGTTLIANMGSDVLQWTGLRAFQVLNGNEVPVEIYFEVQGKHQYGFTLGDYDPERPLVIDPTLEFASFLGGTGAEAAGDVQTDASGNIYVLGDSASSAFPVSSAYQGTLAGSSDITLTKFDSSGKNILYSTFFGGTGADTACALQFDASGNIIVTGISSSTDFPTASAAQGASGGSSDTVVAKFNSTGSSLVFSTYLGGSGTDSCNSVAVNGSSEIAVVGSTASTNFPTSSPYQAASGGGNDVFLTKYSSAGVVQFSTYLGGSASEFTPRVNFDGSGNIYIVGRTSSSNFPVVSAYQGTIGGGEDSFISKFNSSGSSLLYSTFIGGSAGDLLGSFVIDAAGNLYISGGSASTNFPTVNAFQSTYGGSTRDGVILKMNAAGTALIFSTYVGGNGFDTLNDIDVDAEGNVYFIGNSASTNFPLLNAFQTSLSGSQDFVFGRLNASGSSLAMSTYYGGTGQDTGLRGDLDSSGRFVMVGTTGSSDIVATVGAYQTAYGGANDMFMMRLNLPPAASTSRLLDLASPYLIQLSPSHGASGVALNAPILVTFNEPLRPESVNHESFIVSQGHAVLEGTLSVSGDTVRFDPSKTYAPNEPVIVVLTTELQDASGNAFSYTAGIPDTPFAFSFKPVGEVVPGTVHEPGILDQLLNAFRGLIEYVLRAVRF